MTREEAERALAAFGKLPTTTNRPWFDSLQLHEFHPGEWVAVLDPAIPKSGVYLSSPSGPLTFWGALGKMVPHLHLPKSREKILGSTWFGKYQEFERGIAVWEEARDERDDDPNNKYNIAFPITWDLMPNRGTTVQGLVAFFDIRGFTTWSKSEEATPERIQEVVTSLEEAFQSNFLAAPDLAVFVKGTGDGFMVVSAVKHDGSIGSAHVYRFCSVCEETVRSARTWLEREGLHETMAVGCGVTMGPVTGVYILGRFDYVGAVVNEAAKIQTVAYNELCISPEVYAALREIGLGTNGSFMAGKGWRLPVTPEEAP